MYQCMYKKKQQKKYAYLLSCRELDEKIDTTLMSVQQIWSYSWLV